jgi:hypothetical protein
MLSEGNMFNTTSCCALVQMCFRGSDVMNAYCRILTDETDMNQFMDELMYATVPMVLIQLWV